MEFCDPTPGSQKGESISEENLQIFRKVAELFEVDGDIFEDFVCYVSGDTNAHVLTLTREGMNGELRLIRVDRYNKILFSYNGSDTVLMIRTSSVDSVPALGDRLSGLHPVHVGPYTVFVLMPDRRPAAGDVSSTDSGGSASQPSLHR